MGRPLGEIVGKKVGSLVVGRNDGVSVVSAFDALSEGDVVFSTCIVVGWLGGLEGAVLGREIGCLLGIEALVGNSVGTEFKVGVLVGD